MDTLDLETLDKNTWLKRIEQHSHKSRTHYKAMYSTWWGGIVTDPNLMLIPIDDHQVHRGDAVFEAMKSIKGKIYLEKAHLDRMERSSKAIGLKNPFDRAELQSILDQTLKASGLENSLLRVFLGRGPGSFSTNPYDTVGTQFHVIATDLFPVSESKVKEGVVLKTSKIPAKEPWLAQIKSCNYLVNVLMKKESVDQGVDFTVGVDARGFLTESSTENLVLLTSENELVRPEADWVLAGTTMHRAFDLAARLKHEGQIRFIGEKCFNVEDLLKAKEVMMVGTTLDVLPVVQFDGKKIGDGKPGPIAMKLRELVIADQQ